MAVFVVMIRDGIELLRPEVCGTKKEAEAEALGIMAMHVIENT